MLPFYMSPFLAPALSRLLVFFLVALAPIICLRHRGNGVFVSAVSFSSFCLSLAWVDRYFIVFSGGWGQIRFFFRLIRLVNGPVVSGGGGVGGVIGDGVLVVCFRRAVSNGACGWGFFSHSGLL